MAEIEWDDSLSIGIELIDGQHKTLIERLSDLSKAIGMNVGEVETAKVLDFMIDYTDFHFSAEEKHMAEHEYPGLERQKQLHEEFKGYLNRLVEDYREEGPTKDVSTSINVFLRNWLVTHIKGVELEFGEFLNAKGFKLSE